MSVGSKIAEAFVEIGAKLGPLKKGLSAARESIGGFVSSVPGQLAGIGVGAAGAAIGLLKMASDAEEMKSKFSVVFGESAASAEAFATSMAAAVGRSKNELMGFMATLQDSFVPMGFSNDLAKQLSQQVTALGVDLASFNNLSDQEALDSLTSALIGNHEAVRKFGVIITEATLKSKLMEMGIRGGTDAASEQQKALARLQLIMDGTQAAQGDAARTSDSLANSFKGFMGQLSDLGATLGTMLMEPAKEIIGLFREWITMAQVVAASTSGFANFGNVFGFIKDWISEIVNVFLNWDLVAKELGIRMAETFTNMVGRAKTFFENIGIGLKWMVNNWKEIALTIVDVMSTAFINLGTNIRNFFSELWSFIKSGGTDSFEFDWTPLLDGFKSTMNSPEFKEFLPESFQDQLDEVQKEWDRRAQEVADKTSPVLGNAVAEAVNQNVDIGGIINDKEFKKKPDGSKGGGGFHDIVESWKKIQGGVMKGADKAAEQTAKNTQEIAKGVSEMNKKLSSGPQVAVAG